MTIEIYSTDTDAGQITVLRKESKGYAPVKAIQVGNAPRGAVKFTKTGRGFVSNTSGNTVSELDLVDYQEVARITVGNGPRGLGIVPGDKYMLVSNSGSNTVSVVDLETRKEIKQVDVGRDPRHMAIDKSGEFAYICVWGAGHIAKLDLSSLAESNGSGIHVVQTIELGVGSYPYSLNIESGGRYALVACNSLPHVPVIDLASDTVAYKVEVHADGGKSGARAVGFTPDGAYALVTLERSSEAAVICMRDFTVKRYIATGPSPRGIALEPDGLTVLIASFSRSGALSPSMASGSFSPHSLTIVDLKNVDLSNVASPVHYGEVPVGDGPCSVSVFDTATLKNSSRPMMHETILV